MDSFGTFLYQSGISIAVFYLFYWALLRKETWFSLNRLLLFGSLLLAVAIPFVRVTLRAVPEPGTIYYAMDRYFMDGVIVRPSSLAESAGIRLTVGKALLMLYLLGALFFLARFLIQIFQVLYLVKKHGIREFEGYRIVPVDKDISPFSFFTLIFINTEKMKGPELRSILLHEWEHVRRLHTLDIILLEIICIIQWFNPFVWLYKYSLHELHEYEADQAVLSHGENRLNYQKIILNQAFGHNFFPVVHNLINRSFIKKRLIMITRKKSRNITLLKSLLLLPVAAVLVVSFSFTREQGNRSQVKQLITGPQDQKKVYTLQEVDKQPLFNGKYAPYFLLWVREQISDTTAYLDKPLRIDFVVKKNGKLSDITIRPDHVTLDQKYIDDLKKIIASSPRWTPAEKNGEKVDVSVGIPFMVFSTKKSEVPGKQIFFIVEEMPKFQGGDVKTFRQWVADHLKYPVAAAEKHIGGTVYVQFVVEADGSVDQVKVIRGADPALNAEAVHVVKSSPKWTPGKQRGQNVAVAFTIPVVFLTGEEKPASPKTILQVESQVPPPEGEVFFIVEEMPKFRGGTVDDFRKWVAENITYPEIAKKKGISGVEYVQFVVDKEGNVTQVRVIKGVDPVLGAEAVRVVKSSPKWTPGKQRGQNVAVALTIPVTFVLDHQWPSPEHVKIPQDKYTVYVIDGKKATPEQMKNLNTLPVAHITTSQEQKDLAKYGNKETRQVVFITTYRQVPDGTAPPKPVPLKK